MGFAEKAIQLLMVWICIVFILVQLDLWYETYTGKTHTNEAAIYQCVKEGRDLASCQFLINGNGD